MSTAMLVRERPIIFSGPMIRRLLDGSKTQTRRAIKPQPVWRTILDAARSRFNDTGWWWTRKNGTGIHSQPDEDALKEVFSRCLSWCPYGGIGDKLWCRETWFDYGDSYHNKEHWTEADSPSDWYWRSALGADQKSMLRYSADEPDDLIESGSGFRHRKRSSIFMPRWASRIVLEITEVRVEKLDAITEADAIAEGARRFDDIPLAGFDVGRTPSLAARWSMEQPRDTAHCLATARQAFGNYWNKLNGDRSGEWPQIWVWALSFRRVEGGPR